MRAVHSSCQATHHGGDVGGEGRPPGGSLQQDGEQAGEPAGHQGGRPVVGPAQTLPGIFSDKINDEIFSEKYFMAKFCSLSPVFSTLIGRARRIQSALLGALDLCGYFAS